MRGQSI